MRRGTIWAGLLGASLMLNLVLGALLWSAPAAPDRRVRGFDRMIARIETALPEPDRPRFRAVLEAERARYAEQLTALRASRFAVDAAMAQEPFDPQALRAAMTLSSERWMAFSAAFSETLVHAVTEVSAEGRARIAAAGPPGR